MWAHSFIPLYIQGEKSVPTLFVPYIQEEKSMPTQRKTKSVVLARPVHKLLHSHYHCQDLNFHSLCLSKVSFSQPSWSHRHLENGSVVQLVIACVCPTTAFDFRSFQILYRLERIWAHQNNSAAFRVLSPFSTTAL